ncbi:hypothetical protein GGR50DRAFT_118920 [Xylaria sp. CBS 124048]|nr:hypothetical protein GGR50DRAFT_118920 [Xylaria sp. CBS 124048]
MSMCFYCLCGSFVSGRLVLLAMQPLVPIQGPRERYLIPRERQTGSEKISPPNPSTVPRRRHTGIEPQSIHRNLMANGHAHDPRKAFNWHATTKSDKKTYMHLHMLKTPSCFRYCFSLPI